MRRARLEVGRGQEGELFMYPYPLDEQHFLVSFAPRGWEGHGHLRYETTFGLYFMDMDGRRELLDRDDEQGVSAGRMVPLAARPVPHVRPSLVDYSKETGVYFVQDVYEGPGLENLPRGTIHSLRVIALWIDLAVPFAGDYSEANAWSDEKHAKYNHFLEKRLAMEAIEEKNIQALIKKRTGD